jgi:uncharacterized membrane protein YdbT with pleckstrin-like domain
MREISDRYDRYLAGNETAIYACRKHPIVLARAILVFVAGLVGTALVAAVFDGVSLWVFLLDDLYIGWQIVDWWYGEYVITNKRIIRLSGVINRKVSTVPMRKITDVQYYRSLLGRILNYGDMVFDTPGQDRHRPPVLDKVGKPDGIYQTIMSIALNGSKATIPGPPDPDRERQRHWKTTPNGDRTREIPVPEVD